MTRDEAYQVAQGRGWTHVLLSDRHWRSPEQRFLVADCDCISGVGSTWEQALERAARCAERREQEKA